VYGGLYYRHRFRPRLVLLCAALTAVPLIILGYFLLLHPTPIRVLSPVHGASVDRCVPVVVEGRTGLGRGLVVGVYVPAQEVVYLSRVLDAARESWRQVLAVPNSTGDPRAEEITALLKSYRPRLWRVGGVPKQGR
jgi:hypothetical protein